MRSILFGALVLSFCAIAVVHASAAVDWARAEDDALISEQCSSPGLSNNPPVTASQPDPRISAYEKYYQASLEHRVAVFAWQATANKLIFALVVTLVLSGLVFAAIQFYVALRRGPSELTQELELSLQAVKVKSQFLGVITLVLSLAFFYLYLWQVYPIVTRPAATTEAAPK
jgi:hypothetical protein